MLTFVNFNRDASHPHRVIRVRPYKFKSYVFFYSTTFIPNTSLSLIKAQISLENVDQKSFCIQIIGNRLEKGEILEEFKGSLK